MNKKLCAAAFAAMVSLNVSAARAEEAMSHEPSAQQLVPPHQVEMYLDGFHNYKREEHVPVAKQSQLRVAHYCKHVSPNLIQCLIYNGNGPDAKVVGIEYVIPDAVWAKLPPAEKKLWHPHDGEVDSGMLRMPGLDAEKEKATLAFVKGTHGKTYHLWQFDKDEIPMGEPQLMWSVDPKQVADKTKEAMTRRQNDPTF